MATPQTTPEKGSWRDRLSAVPGTDDGDREQQEGWNDEMIASALLVATASVAQQVVVVLVGDRDYRVPATLIHSSDDGTPRLSLLTQLEALDEDPLSTESVQISAVDAHGKTCVVTITAPVHPQLFRELREIEQLLLRSLSPAPTTDSPTESRTPSVAPPALT